MLLEEIRKMLSENALVPLWPEAGLALGLSRDSAYRYARSGDIKTIKIGQVKKVPTSWLREKLEIDAA